MDRINGVRRTVYSEHNFKVSVNINHHLMSEHNSFVGF